MQTLWNWGKSLCLIFAIAVASACGGGGSSGTVTAEEPTNGGLVGEPLDPGQEPDPEPGPPPEPEPGPEPSPTDPGLNDFSPGFPPTGSQPTSLSDTPVVSLTLAYPTSGIPTGRRVVVSAYQEDPGSMAPGKLAWRRLFFTRGETSQRIVEFPGVPLTPNGSDGSITLLIDAVVFNDGWGAGPRVEYAAVPRTRVEFIPQDQDGRTVY